MKNIYQKMKQKQKPIFMHYKNLLLTIVMALVASLTFAQNQPLEGFNYGNATAPTGKEWESPELLAYNKLQPRAWFTSFKNETEARQVLPENSSFWQSLNGTWKFHFAKNPAERPANFYEPAFDVSKWDNIPVPCSWNMVGIGKDGSQKYGTPIYVNQPVIFYHQVQPGDWKKGVMREPPHNWTTYEYRNEVGSFRRTFTIPQDWNGREFFISFDGVDSFFYLWINGHYVGFSKNSRDAAHFDITKFAHVGENTVSVEVYRNSDGSFLEAQDMFRLPGIFRTVAVYSTPKVHFTDLVAIPALDGRNGKLRVTTTFENLSGKKVKELNIAYRLFKNKLFTSENEPTDIETSMTWKYNKSLPIDKPVEAMMELNVENVKTWTAEEPNLYVLVAELQDKKGKVIETISTQVGFRTVEIKDVPANEDEFGLAGRYFLINGKPVKLKGVNRHETNPVLGHAITREQMKEEVMMMKRANINHVRTSHYSYDPYWYYLCNIYGIYLEGEANLESHEYYYGAASISHPVEWRAAHIARMMEQAHARVNDPSIVIWSLGNEAGPGDNFKASYAAMKAFDPSRPVQYERNNDIVDMGSNQYPSVNWVRSAVKGTMGIKYPFHISEYAHSMGNAVGNLIDYWEAIESTNFFCGGAIWDWIDQSMYNYTKDGKRYLAYGGDFGDYPNDREFVMNGIIFGDMEPKPQYYEVKKVYQYVGVKWADEAKTAIDVFNKNYYTDDLSDYDVQYILCADGAEVKRGTVDLGSVAPRSHKIVKLNGINMQELDAQKEYFVTIQFMLKNNMPWAKAGYVQAEEQLLVKKATEAVQELQSAASGKLLVDETPSKQATVKGQNFEVVFNLEQGNIQSLCYNDQEMIANGNGPQLDAYRAPVNNDNWADRGWHDNGLDRLQHMAKKATILKNRADGNVVLAFTVESKAPDHEFCFTTNQVYTIAPDGTIELHSSITSNKPTLVLPRLGFAMQLPAQFENLRYYGRGPIDNYPDRKTAQNIAIYNNKVYEEFENFPKPQDMANHQETRWCQLTNNSGDGLFFYSNQPISISALPYSAQELQAAKHPYELPASKGTWLHIDKAITGLGGNSCGQGGPLEYDRVKAIPQTFAFVIRPVAGATPKAAYKLNGISPLTILRDVEGNVTVEGGNTNAQLQYAILPQAKNAKRLKFKPYTGAVNMREGGTIRVFDSNEPNIVYEQTFSRIENVPVTVTFASSVESGEGDAEHLVDGNPSTYWHTMWSVTVANYPHWVDFDCGTVKQLKGFVYLPRQDSQNGNIKGYRIQTSTDGQNWSEPVCEGEFENNQKEKRVLFNKPVKARYLRFTALSSQDGQDFATGSEFSILEQ